MKLINTEIKDVILIKPTPFEDNRGVINKHFDSIMLKELELLSNVKESFFSKSHFNVIRGFHYQYETTKILTLISGTVLDITYDLRKESPTFGHLQKIELNSQDGLSIYMPAGIAHAYLITSKDGATFNYLCSDSHAPGQEGGFHWTSFNANWGVTNPIISTRDAELPVYQTSK